MGDNNMMNGFGLFSLVESIVGNAIGKGSSKSLTRESKQSAIDNNRETYLDYSTGCFRLVSNNHKAKVVFKNCELGTGYLYDMDEKKIIHWIGKPQRTFETEKKKLEEEAKRLGLRS